LRKSISLVVAALVLATAVGLAQGPEIQDQITASGQTAIRTAIEQVAPAVVRIEAARRVSTWWDELMDDPFLRRFFGEPDQDGRLVTSVGSGFIIEEQGNYYVLTNAHVVQDAESVKITAQDGRELPADIVGTDTLLDLAVLALRDGNALIPAPLGDSTQLRIGDWVIAIGNPLGLSHTVTLGIVSALDRAVPRPDGGGYFRRMIQTDAAINPGNSGGPLVSAYGEVVGMNTLIARSTRAGVAVEGINFAVPISEIRRVLPGLIAEGVVTRAWLGVYIQDITPAMERQFGVRAGTGVLISDTVRDAPAREAGLRSGDVIVAIDDRPVGNTDELQSEIMYRNVGETVQVRIIRDGVELDVPVTLAARPDEATLAATPPAIEEGVEAFGLRVSTIPPAVREQYGLHTDSGVFVTAVEPGSRAHWSGLERGDIVLEVNRTPVEGVSGWEELVEELDEDADVMLTILRAGRTLYLVLR